jgi:DNA-directed RNA polymerase subunit RPC12/RpoP
VPVNTTFACPKCGAPLRAAEGVLQVECEYCGSTVVVPAELRPVPPPPAPQVTSTRIVINMADGQSMAAVPAGTPAAAVMPGARRMARRGALGCLLFWVLLLVVLGVGVGFFVQSAAPTFLPNLFAGGYARLDAEFGAAGTLKDPIDVGVDGNGTMYAVDYSTEHVYRFDKQGTYLGSWPIEEGIPQALAAETSGKVYVVSNDKIGKYEGPTGELLATFEPAPDLIFGPQDVALMPNGDLITYAYQGEDYLLRLSSGGTEIARYPRPITEHDPAISPVPWQVRLAANSQGSIYVLYTGSTSPSVYMYTPGASYTGRFGASGDGEGEFSNPTDVAADSTGRVYVADFKGVQVFTPEGDYDGLIRMPFTGSVSGMTVDADDNLLVVSRHNDKIYRFVPNEP